MTLGQPDNLRLPPASLEAEQALLGALLANSAKAYDRVSAFLAPEHFADAIHGRIYAAIRRRCEAGQIADAVTLRREFENSGELAEVGGPAYLAQLLSAMVSVVSAGEYGRLIFDCYQRRQLIAAGSLAIERAFGAALGEGEAQMDAADILQALDAELAQLSRSGAGGQDARGTDAVVGEVMAGFQAAMERRGGLAGVTTGYAGLDRMLGGFLPGQLILLAGRPAMGKTAISLGLTTRTAAAGTRVFYASAEMAAAQVLARAHAAVAGLPIGAVLRGGYEAPVPPERGGGTAWKRLTPESRETREIGEAARRISGLPIQWDDSAGATVAGIRAKARLMKRRGGLDLIVVDYLGRLKPSSRALAYGNRVQEVSEMARAMKELARELEVPVVLLSQLSRAVEQRDNKRPVLSDLRDSGEIEQEADVVLFLYRDHYYALKERPVRGPREKGEAFEQRLEEHGRRLEHAAGRAEIDVAKQRQGPVGPVRLRFADSQTWFFNEGEAEPAIPGLPE